MDETKVTNHQYVEFLKGRQYIINAGSVGEPRDGDGRAKYVIWDNRARCLHVRFVPYGASEAGPVQRQEPVESSGSRAQVERSLI